MATEHSWVRPSEFAYDRSMVRDVATTLAGMRACVSIQQLGTIDHIARALSDTFAEFYPGFDAERFHTMAKTGQR